MIMNRCEMFVEADGQTDQYGLRIAGKHRTFVIRGLSREEMNQHLSSLREQFDTLTSCFDAFSQASGEKTQ